MGRLSGATSFHVNHQQPAPPSPGLELLRGKITTTTPSYLEHRAPSSESFRPPPHALRALAYSSAHPRFARRRPSPPTMAVAVAAPLQEVQLNDKLYVSQNAPKRM